MKDPFSVMFRIGNFTIWHRDKGGVDGACVHFARAHHGDEKVLKQIQSCILFDWKYQFTESGEPLYSTQGIVLSWFFHAAYHHFGQSREKADRWLNANLFDILHFAENPIDSARSSVQGIYGEYKEKPEDRAKSAASVVYGWMVRETWPWWRNYRLHIHHYRFSHPRLNKAFDKIGIGMGDTPSLMQSIEW